MCFVCRIKYFKKEKLVILKNTDIISDGCYKKGGYNSAHIFCVLCLFSRQMLAHPSTPRKQDFRYASKNRDKKFFVAHLAAFYPDNCLRIPAHKVPKDRDRQDKNISLAYNKQLFIPINTCASLRTTRDKNLRFLPPGVRINGVLYFVRFGNHPDIIFNFQFYIV